MSKSDMVYRYTASKIEYLHSIADTGRGKGYLAELRHGIGKKPGELPSLWWLIFDRIDEELKGSKCASNAEWAVYTALTLYACISRVTTGLCMKRAILWEERLITLQTAMMMKNVL